MAEQADSKVPQIRFKGFEGEWVEKILGDESGEIVAGGDVDKSKLLKKGQYPVLANSLQNRGVLGFYNKEFRVRAPAVTVTGRGDVGHAVARETNFTPVVRLLSIKVAHDVHFLEKAINNHQVWVESTGVPQLTVPQLSEYQICFPKDDSEETKIGGYFKELDGMIGLHQRKHGKLVTLKQAMLQKMFPQNGATTPEIRFKGFEEPWVEKKLGQCVLIQRGGSPRPIEDFITQNADGVNWVKIGDVKLGLRYITKTKEKIRKEGVKMSREVFKGDLILSNSMSFGRPYIMGIDGCIHDGWLLIRNDKELFDVDYLLQILGSENMLSQYRALAAGGVVNNLNSALVQSTNISFPVKEEQQKIGTYFRQLDTLITKHATQLEKLKQLKSACLEKMFV